MTFTEAAEAVLADTRRAMSADEIWVEIKRRGLVDTDGKTPIATLYTAMMRKSANWGAEDDDRTPIFYRRGGGAFGRWVDLTPEQRKAIVASVETPSPTMVWRELHDKVKTDPSWQERIAALAARRTQVGAEIAGWIRKYLDRTVTLEALRAEFDQRTRTDWDCFGFGGTGFAMLLNMITKTVAAQPTFEALVRTAMAVPRDDIAARASLQALATALNTLRKTGDKKRLPHPNRIPQLFSALWQVQAPEAWPTYYKSARDALDETEVVAASDDPIESYLAFRTPYKQLASELSISMLEFEQLCKLQQEADDGSDDDDEPDTDSASAWLFQCRPATFDLRRAVEDLTELTWTIRKHRRRIHEGDAVYLWESGLEAALIATGTITSEPATQPEDPKQLPYYRDATDADGETLRVHLHVDRVVRPPLARRQILAAPKLADVQLFRSAQGTNFKLPSEVVAALEALLEKRRDAPDRSYWKIAPGRDAEEWPTMERESVIAVSWHEHRVGDLREYATKSDLDHKFAELEPELSESKRRARVEQLWMFREIAVGDIIVANRGFSKVVGTGTVTGDYFYRADHKFPHARPVRWDRTDAREIDDQGPRWRPTVVALPPEDYDALFDEDDKIADTAPKVPIAPVPTAQPYSIQDALNHVFLSHADLTRLLELLKYKKNLVLQGPPGVGKTFVAAELAYVLLAEPVNEFETPGRISLVS